MKQILLSAALLIGSAVPAFAQCEASKSQCDGAKATPVAEAQDAKTCPLEAAKAKLVAAKEQACATKQAQTVADAAGCASEKSECSSEKAALVADQGECAEQKSQCSSEKALMVADAGSEKKFCRTSTEGHLTNVRAQLVALESDLTAMRSSCSSAKAECGAEKSSCSSEKAALVAGDAECSDEQEAGCCESEQAELVAEAFPTCNVALVTELNQSRAKLAVMRAKASVERAQIAFVTSREAADAPKAQPVSEAAVTGGECTAKKQCSSEGVQ